MQFYPNEATEETSLENLLIPNVWYWLVRLHRVDAVWAIIGLI